MSWIDKKKHTLNQNKKIKTNLISYLCFLYYGISKIILNNFLEKPWLKKSQYTIP